jgi:hypothetical protein
MNKKKEQERGRKNEKKEGVRVKRRFRKTKTN